MPPEDVVPNDGTPAEPAAITPSDPSAVTKTEDRAVIAPSNAPRDQRPGIADLFEEGKKAGLLDGVPVEAVIKSDAKVAEPAAEGKPDAKAAEAAEAAKPSDADVAKLEGKTAEDLAKLVAASPEDLAKITAAATEKTDADKTKADLDKLLSTFEDPAVLNAALERAGVDKIGELPAVKSLVGRLVQGARDSTRAEVMKAQAQAAQLAEVTAEGRAAKGKLVNALNKLVEDIEAGDKLEGEYSVPTQQAIETAFDEYAGAAVGEYHTKTWNNQSEAIYSLPEMGGPVVEGSTKTPPPPFNEAQKALLEAAKGQPSEVWMAAHLAVQRDQLWNWAQAEARAENQGSFENDKVLLVAAHAKEIKDLTATHTAALKVAHDEARAEALADITAGKTPPKTPKSTVGVITARSDDDDEAMFKGKSPGEIRTILKSREAAGVEV